MLLAYIIQSVSKKTNYIVVGANPGSKAEKAKKIGIETITEDKLKEILDD